MLSKDKIITHCISKIEQNISALEADHEALKLALADETKSSAGDKYETGREMINQEKNKVLDQINAMRNHKNGLIQIQSLPTPGMVAYGALVSTTLGNFLIATAMGKLSPPYENVFVISASSPIFKAMQTKKTGEIFEWQNKQLTIESIA